MQPVRARALAHPILLAALVVVSATELGCPSATVTAPVTKPTPVPVAKAIEPPEFPTHWALHASHNLSLRGKLDLGKDGTLYVGRGGERWLDKHDGTAPTPAKTLIDEPLASLVRAPNGAIVFVAASGAVYPAGSDNLGPVGEKRAAPPGLRSVTIGRGSIVGISEGKTLMRTADFGASWTKIALPITDGVATYVALNANGDGALLMSPQRLFVTNDDGASWKPLASPGIGARRLVSDTNGDVVLEGLDASAVLRQGPARFERVNRTPSSDFVLSVPSDDGALTYAEGINEGRAAVSGKHFVEVVSDPDDTTRWRFATGELGGKTAVRKIGELDGCDSALVGRSSTIIEIGCQRTSTTRSWGNKPYYGGNAERPELHLYRSEDEGKTWKPDGTVNAVDRQKHLWVLEDGAVIIDGACKTVKSPDTICDEGAPLVRVPGNKAFAKIGVPHSNATFVALAAASGNGKVYAVGSSSYGRYSLFVSTDGGRDFVRKTLPTVTADDEPGKTYVAEVGDIALSVDEVGAVHVAANSGSRWLGFTTSDDGATFKSQLLPFEAIALDLSGKRGFAYSGDGAGFETLDGGVTWGKVAAPITDDAGHVACGYYGCLIGTHATRVGWELKTAGDLKPVEPPHEKKPVSGASMHCALDGDRWTMLPNATKASLDETGLGGGARWFSQVRDSAKGSVSALVPVWDAKKGLETKEVVLFGPAAKDTATYSVMSNGALVALRYSYKRDTPAKVGGFAPITPRQTVDVEVAWFDGATDKVHKGTLRGVGPLVPSSDLYEGSSVTAATARVNFVSFARGGVHVRPLASSGADAVLHFVDDNGKVEKLSFPETPSKDVRGRNLYLHYNAMRAGKRSLMWATASGGQQLLMAWSNPTGTVWETKTWGLWPELEGFSSGDSQMRILSGTEQPTMAIFQPGHEGIAASAWGTTLRADSDPASAFAIPTTKALGDPARACDKASAAWPRVIAPYAVGTRHMVTLTGDGANVTMATGNAVVHVNPANGEACLGDYDAYAIQRPPTGQYSAIVSNDDLAHTTVFFVGNAVNDVRVRSAQCTYDKDKQPLPDALKSADGFSE